MRTVFVDTSGFYAFLDKTDPFHREAKELILRGREENWDLLTSSLVVQETWALIQARLGWDALEDWLCSLLPLCQVVWVDERLYELGAARARQARERRLSLTDCVSFEVMLAHGCRAAIANDEHFRRNGFPLP